MPFETIAQARNIANDGGVIIVMPGTYNERVDFDGKAITVRSSDPDDWEIVKTTILKGSSGRSCVVFDDGEGSDSIIEGFTITAGGGTYHDEYFYYYEVQIHDRVGGGIFCLDSSPTIRKCNIVGNGFYDQNFYEPKYGGGIALLGDCQATITNCFIVNNFAYRYGGGIAIRSRIPSEATSTIRNCTITNNRCTDYDNNIYYFQVDSWGAYTTISNTIIWSQDDECFLAGDTSLVTYSCIKQAYFNDVRDHFDAAQFYDHTLVGGNISESPGYVYSVELWPFLDGDYHIGGQSACVNAGDPCFIGIETDIDGEPRVMWGRVDIGADEVAPSIIVTKPAGGEIWVANSIHNIEWESRVFTGNVDILYSIDNGGNWILIQSDTPDTGSYQWQLPGAVDSDECLVQVVANTEPEYIEYEVSGVFTIHPSTPGAAVSSYWPTLGSDYRRDGLANGIGPEIGCVKWQFATGGAVMAGVPIGAGGNVHIACEDGLIYTVDPNGGLVWSYDTGSMVMSCPSVGADGSVYVGCENGKLYAISAEGQIRWTSSTDALVYSTAAVGDDGNVYFGSVDGKLYALGADGSELWSFTTDGPLGNGSILASPAIGDDGAVYIGGVYDPDLYALNPVDGSVNWVCDIEQSSEGWMVASPVVGSDGRVYAGLVNDPNFYAVNPVDGSVIWKKDLVEPLTNPNSAWYEADYEENYPGASCWSEPAVGPDGTIYVSFDDPYLRALNPDGSVKWITRLGMVGGFTLSVGSDGKIYAASDDGALCVVGGDGTELARFVSNDILGYPVIAEDGTVYVSDADNVLWAISSDSCDSESADLHRPPDVTGDRAVNLSDFAALAGDWLLCSDTDPDANCNYSGDGVYLDGDINRNLYVDLADVAAIADKWLTIE